MIVERLRTRHFRHLGELDLGLGPGLTVIRGPNEAGKSSIVAALLLGFFTRATTTAKEVLEQRCWDDDQAFTIELVIRDVDSRLELVKDFGARTQTLRDLTTDQVVKDASAIERRLADLLGCPSQAFFESTACVKHDELAAIKKDPSALSDRLQRLVTGPDDTNVTAALAGLNSDRGKLERGLAHPAQSPGLVLDARRRVEGLTIRRNEAVAALRGRHAWEDELAKRHERLQTDRAEHERLSATRRDNDEAIENARRLAELGARLKKQQQIDELTGKLAAVDAELGPLARLADADRDANRVQDLGQQIKGLESIPKALGPAAPSPLKRVALPLAAILLALGVLLGLLINPLGFALVALGAVSLVAYLAIPGQPFPAPDPSRAKIDELRREAGDLAAKHGFASPEDLLQARAGFLTLRERRRAIETQLGQLLGGDPTPERIARFRKEAEKVGPEYLARTGKRRDLETAELLPEVRAFADGRVHDDLAARQALRRLDERITALDERIVASEKRETELEALLRQPGPSPEDVEALEDELAEARERATILERRLDAVREAIAAIEEARTAVMTTVSEQIQPFIGERLARVTGGRYAAARVSSADLAVSVARPGTNRFIGLDRLSRGTRDQAYLAARLALVDRICDGREPPLLVDDALASFDDERARRMLEVLRDFARGRQVLLFSWSDRYDSLADRVVDLTTVVRPLASVG